MEPKLLIFSPSALLHILLILTLFTSPFQLGVLAASSGLLFDFYAASCPTAEAMVKNTLRSASTDDPTIPAKLLRLLFHDCMVEGCDGSVLLEGNETERSDPANASLGGFSVVESAKGLLELFCPETVSCADILALAARDAVEFAGGPSIQIPTGRRDGRVSSVSNVRPNIVDTSFTMDEMLELFSSKGLSLEDLVTLSGSAHCSSFSDRFQEDSKGNLTPIDASLDRIYANELIKQCPAGVDKSITVNNDPETSLLFDNQYYRNLISHKGLFQSDSVLFSDGRTKAKVEEFSDSQYMFFEKWTESFLKLSSVGVKTGDEGEVRTSCRAING
ncbi:PREDICTED: peroxidase 46-like isoform X2 [Nelumbo nucifera]|uniref:Peroxidase n=1 Tax=Nelumbo nucifera TaxID=4432 RepID=A0A1U8AL39_NELNU|nr:PREDICTED: peroxidase 46-like isoform X2 [Nelumbo nucifera]